MNNILIYCFFNTLCLCVLVAKKYFRLKLVQKNKKIGGNNVS